MTLPGPGLRRPVDADVAGLFSVHGDPRVWRLDPDELHLDLDDTRRFMAPRMRHWEQHGFGYWTVTVPRAWWPAGITSPEDPAQVVAGLGGTEVYDLAGTEVLNVYFRLSPAVHGRGLAGLVVTSAIRAAGERAPGLDLVVRTRPANAAALRVAERAGFADEGLQPGTTDMRLLRLAAR